METDTQLTFEGTKEEQELAARAFELMKRKGMLFAANAPIRMNLESIARALTKAGAPLAGADPARIMPKIEGALLKNDAVFAHSGNGEFVTTKAGRAYRTEAGENIHTFRERLNTEATALDAQAAKEYASSLMSRSAERSAIVETIVEIPAAPIATPRYPQPPAPVTFESPTLIPQHLIPPPPVDEAEAAREARGPAAPAGRDVAASVAPGPAPTQIPPRPPTPEEIPPLPPRPTTQPAAPVAPPAQPAVGPVPAAPPAQEPAAAPPQAPAAAAPTAPAPAQTPAETVTPPPPRRAAPTAPAAEPAAPVITGPVEVQIQTAEGPVTIDLRDSVDDILANAAVAQALTDMIEGAIATDARLARIGSEIFPEEAIERFSKGDFRRIREYLDEPETGGVASDADIVADVLGRRPEHPDFDRLRFSISFRLSKEKKDFEFAGIDTDRLWISAGASPVPPPPVRKAAEIGQDYRFLEDPAIVSVEEEEEPFQETPGPLDYSLTYYEYENGVLPYDRRAKQLFRGPVFEEQRASLVRFEVPQLYGAFIAELRYPTGNRGGFIMGLNELFTEHFVPGAKFTIVPTDRGEDVFEIRFTRADEREENLLFLDERRGRYVFRPVSYAVEVDPVMILSQERYGKLHNHKKLDESERKRVDVIIANAFEAVADVVDGKLWAVFDDIYPVVNIERPISRSWLRTLLSGAYPFFYPDESTEGAYFYDASRRPS